MNYWGYPRYVPVAERRAKAEKVATKALKTGVKFAPIAPYRGAIAKTFWGKAWCDNLEHYSDYANRLPRGRTYVRNGSVIDLTLRGGEVLAKVMGSSLYNVKVTIAKVTPAHWQALGADCAGSIDSMVALLQGKLSQPVMQRICKPGTGLFPAPSDIHFRCSCPDSASMCKHVAAVLYGIGARLDQQPDLLFTLRQVDAKDLIAQAATRVPVSTKQPATSKVLDEAELADVFGLELDTTAQAARWPSKTSASKAPVSKTAKRSSGNGLQATAPTLQKPTKTKAPVKAAAAPRHGNTV